MTVRVMVEKGELLHLGEHGVVDCVLHWGMPPSCFSRKFVQRVLRIMNEQIGALEEAQMAPVFVMDRRRGG